MTLQTWDTRQPPAADFERAWGGMLAACPHANFSFDLRYLAWEARHDRHAVAVRVEEGGRLGAIVLRVCGSTLVSGWPWRWQAIVAAPDRGSAAGLTPDDGEWLMAAARRVAGGRRLRCLLPLAVPASRGGFRAGATLMRRTDADGEQLLAQFDVNKRRAVKRAIREGWEVREAATVEERRAFAVIRREVDLMHGHRVSELGPGTPEPGEDWREWELPWMWLLVAVRGGKVGAGSGFGITPGGTIEYRANGSDAEARKLGVNALLAWEALRGAHGRGCHWMNWGGVTEFKRELGGERVEIHCCLGGGAAWALPNAVSARWHDALWRLRPLARAVRSRLRPS